MNQAIRIDHESGIPKYKQVVQLIISDIEAGIFRQGQRVPSINETSEELLLSRDTVEKAYIHLKKEGILTSVRGKGYYVNTTKVGKKYKIALILNKLSNYKRSIYYSMVETLGNKAKVDVFIYNYDNDQFQEILDNQRNNYDYYAILPHTRGDESEMVEVIRSLPKEKVILIDRNLAMLKDYPVVYQEYEKDIQAALGEAIGLIRKYKKIHLVFPKNEYYPGSIHRGFQIFCQVNELKFSIMDSLREEDVQSDEAYVFIADDDLYRFIKITRKKSWTLGSDVGVVAYNENQVKEILENGISTISTNHDEIGRLAGEMILSKNFSRIKSPFQFIQRNSL